MVKEKGGHHYDGRTSHGFAEDCIKKAKKTSSCYAVLYIYIYDYALDGECVACTAKKPNVR